MAPSLCRGQCRGQTAERDGPGRGCLLGSGTELRRYGQARFCGPSLPCEMRSRLAAQEKREGSPQPPGMGGAALLVEWFEAEPPLRRPSEQLSGISNLQCQYPSLTYVMCMYQVMLVYKQRTAVFRIMYAPGQQ